jgi:hypothetical protein
MSDEGFNGGEIFLVSSDGAMPRDITPGRTSIPSGFSWNGPDKIVFTETVGGSSRIRDRYLTQQRGNALERG